MRAFLQCLVIVCSFLLALPLGWCCMLTFRTAERSEQAPAGEECCCCHQTPGKTAPEPSRAPSPTRCCPCPESFSTPPAKVQIVSPDLSLAGFVDLPRPGPTCPDLAIG